MKISCSAEQIQNICCRRAQFERRARKTGSLSGLLYNGKRENLRRQDDRSSFRYLDRYEPHLLAMTAVIILCSMVDAFLTLEILKKGGQELNIFANALISQGLYVFVISKYFITAIGVIVLIMHKHHPLYFGLKVKHIIYSFVFIYCMLLIYEVSIIVKMS